MNAAGMTFRYTSDDEFRVAGDDDYCVAIAGEYCPCSECDRMETEIQRKYSRDYWLDRAREAVRDRRNRFRPRDWDDAIEEACRAIDRLREQP